MLIYAELYIETKTERRKNLHSDGIKTDSDFFVSFLSEMQKYDVKFDMPYMFLP